MSNQYSGKVASIKNKLKNYTDESYLSMSLTCLHEPNKRIDFLERLPWTCLLTLKWKLGQNNGKENISKATFTKIVNETHLLQSSATDLEEDGNVMLKMRALLISQMLYQTPLKRQVRSIFRQIFWFIGSDNYLIQDKFKYLSAISLTDFYNISLHLIYIISRPSGAVIMNISDILVNLHPKYPISIIANYIKFISCTKNNLRDYIESHTIAENHKWEFFADTPFVYKPTLFEGDKLYFFSKEIFIESICRIVIDGLKLELKETFKSEFSAILEKYIEELLRECNCKFLTEDKIKKIYSSNSIRNAKVVDFIVSERSGAVYIDAKAIEPNSVVKTEQSSAVLKSRLEGSFIKGIEQTQACAKKLIESKVLEKNDNDVALIVLHKDHYFSSALEVAEHLDTQLKSRLVEQHGNIYINLKRTFYVTIDDLEVMLEHCNCTGEGIIDIVNQFTDSINNSENRYFSFSMYITNLFNTPLNLPRGINDIREKFESELITYNKSKYKYWSGNFEYYFQCMNTISKNQT